MTLLEILKSIPQDFNEPMGICNYVYHHPEYAVRHIDQLENMFPHWPEFSGNQEFPVQSDAGSALAFVAAVHNNTMWSKTHPYGQARRRLIGHMIEALTYATA